MEAEESVQRMNRDLIRAAALVGRDEARFLVDTYYSIQDFRIQGMNQVRSLVESGEPNAVLMYTSDQMIVLEKQVQRALVAFSQGHPVGRWAESIVGIGPVLSAGLLAHIDIEKAPTVGHIWRFAGQDPTSIWEKGQKRPWNAKLKVICWKIGESFVKVQANERDYYGKIYVARKAQEIERNEHFAFRDQALEIIGRKKIGKDTDAYKNYSIGKLPPAHIHARAKRYAVHIFLAHWHHVAYEIHYQQPPPKPYIIEHSNGAHNDYLGPPNWPMK